MRCINPASERFAGGRRRIHARAVRWRPALWLTVVVAALAPAAGAQERDGVKLVPLYRLERQDRSDSLYTVNESEVQALSRDRNWVNRGLVGYGAAPVEEGRNLVELRRYREQIRVRGRPVVYHYFANFLKRPNPRLTLQPMGIKVWRTRAPGTVPVFASTNLNDRCIYFAFSRLALQQFDEDYREATGLPRKSLGLVFYMYPPNYQRSIAVPPDFAPLDWSLLRGPKYRYGPAVVEHEGQRYLFYGGNIDRPDRPPLCDHVLLRVGEQVDGAWQYGAEKVVLSAGDDWSQGATPYDRQRAGIPTVVAGDFRWQRPGTDNAQTFPWAMFYSAWDKPVNQGGKRQIALALAAELAGPWHKVGLIVEDPGPGINRPAAVSLDGKGRVLLLYSVSGRPCLVRELDLSDVNHPVVVSERPMASAGLTTRMDTPESMPIAGSIALDPATGRLWHVRDQNPRSVIQPRICESLQLASIPLDEFTAADGVWTVHADFAAPEYGFLRLFSPGFVRTGQGHIAGTGFELYISTGSREGPVDESMMGYRIHTLSVDPSRIEGEDAGPGAVEEAPEAGQ